MVAATLMLDDGAISSAAGNVGDDSAHDDIGGRSRRHKMTGTTEHIRIGQLEIRFLLEGGATAGSLAMFEFDVPANARVPIAHSHDAYEETIYGLEGMLTWTVEARVYNVGAGEVLCIPRGAVHRFDNTSGADTTMLAVITPGVLSPDYFRELAALAAAGGGPPNMTAIADVMRRHGLTPAP